MIWNLLEVELSKQILTPLIQKLISKVDKVLYNFLISAKKKSLHPMSLIRGSNNIFFSANEAAQRASISNYLLARITGTILVLDTDEVLQADKCPKVNIGLNLKFSRRNQLVKISSLSSYTYNV